LVEAKRGHWKALFGARTQPGWWAHLVARRPKLAEVRLRATCFGGQPSWSRERRLGAPRTHPHKHYANLPPQQGRGFARGETVEVNRQCTNLMTTFQASRSRRPRAR